jgi:hypothetical protein
MPRVQLTANQVIEIKSDGDYLTLAILSGEVLYKVGSNNFNNNTDLKLNDRVVSDTLKFRSASESLFIKALVASEIQYRTN